jgi:hypothetical protein
VSSELLVLSGATVEVPSSPEYPDGWAPLQGDAVIERISLVFGQVL